MWSKTKGGTGEGKCRLDLCEGQDNQYLDKGGRLGAG